MPQWMYGQADIEQRQIGCGLGLVGGFGLVLHTLLCVGNHTNNTNSNSTAGPKHTATCPVTP